MAYRYPTRKINGKTKLLHRHVAEQDAGRPLSPEEHVHHRDHDPFNWARDNIQILPAETHRQLHADERLVYPRTKDCMICGTEFTPHPTKRKRAKTCSRVCANQLRSRTEKITKSQGKNNAAE